MEKERIQPPQAASRTLRFPVWGLMTLYERDSLPLPLLSRRDNLWWWHIELTEPEAWASLRVHKAVRRNHPDWYTSLRGTAVMQFDNLRDLLGLAGQVNPCPDGLCFGLRYKQRLDEWTATFVRWEHIQQYERAAG